MRDNLKIKLLNLPQEPGCYLMKNKKGTIIYVGKAKNLKSRVNSYFSGAHDYKVEKMVSLIDDFEFIVTKSEKEALILELNLIKKHKPQFNVLFMDDKVYPYIKITDEEYPRLIISRNRTKDKNAKVFGPYPDSKAARKMISLLGRIYPTRKCHPLEKKLCLYYHLGQCMGMCELEVDKKEYMLMIDEIEKILKGDTKELVVQHLKKQKEHIEKLEFEQAGAIQEILDAISHISSTQEVQTNIKSDNFDIFNYYVHNGYISIVTIEIRMGKVINTKKYFSPLYESPDNALISYINQYYLENPLVKEIIVPKDFNNDLFIDEISSRIFWPQRGSKVRYIEMGLNNAKHHLEQQFSLFNSLPDKIALASKQLDDILDLNVVNIEMFDVSHTAGSNTVAAMVSFNEGLPNKKEYRLYRLDDYQADTDAIKEVIYRRYFRLLKDNLEFPDLIIVDGGIAQINSAKAVLDSLNINIEVVGLIKDEYHNTRALLNVDNIELDINKASELFFLFSRMQDEVHRFAINYHKKLRSKSQTRSILDDIEGVGPARKAALLAHFKNLNNIKRATLDELSEVVSLKIAQNIKETLQEE